MNSKENDKALDLEELDQISGGTVIATQDASGYDMAIFTLSGGWGAMADFANDLKQCKALVSKDKNWLGAMEKEVAAATAAGDSHQTNYVTQLLATTKKELGIK